VSLKLGGGGPIAGGRLSEDRGQAMVEFVLVAPVLLLMIYGVVLFAVLFKNWIVFTDAVRTAARAAAVCRFNGGDFSQATSVYASNISNINSMPGGAFTPDPALPAPQGSCASGQTVNVTASMSYSITFFGFGKSGTLNSSIQERVE
jgi:Flp pilus assembly protein TadG